MADPKLVEYIHAALAHGKSREDLYRELLSQGWTVAAIEECLRSVKTVEHKEDTQKKTIRIILAIGVVLVAAGVFSFIASNWQAMSKPAKVLVIVAAMLVAYIAGWFLKERAGYAKTGQALYLLGAIIYGGGIFLVAQMFNIRANWPDGFILWMLGMLAMAFAVESYPMFAVAIPLGFISIIGHPFYIFGVVWSEERFLLTSSILLAFATIVVFLTGWAMHRRLPPEIRGHY